MVRSILVVIAFAVLTAGCAAPEENTDPGGTPPAMPVLAFMTSQQGEGPNLTYSITGPDTVEAGWVTIDVTTDAFEPHQALFIQLPENMTYENFKTRLHDSMGNPKNFTYPDDVEMRGGVGVVTFGQTGSAHIELPAGNYAVVCQIPGPIGPHMAHGMMKPFTVTPRAGLGPRAPEPAFTLTMTEFGYSLDKNITPGRHTFAIHNGGLEPHEAPIVKLDANVTIQQFLEALEQGGAPPPGVGVGGIPDIRPGGTAYATMDFTEGEYGTFCFVPAKSDHMPHLAHGMVTQFRVA